MFDFEASVTATHFEGRKRRKREWNVLGMSENVASCKNNQESEKKQVLNQGGEEGQPLGSTFPHQRPPSLLPHFKQNTPGNSSEHSYTYESWDVARWMDLVSCENSGEQRRMTLGATYCIK